MKEEIENRMKAILDPTQEPKKQKPAGTDLTDEQFQSLSKQERTQRLNASFKFKTEMLSEKILVMDSTIQ